MVKSASPPPPPPPRLRRPPPFDSSFGERFKGVRRRSWGRWVSEIRIPHSRDKIWLGSYGTAEQAARAYDIASLLLRGPSCTAYLNFSDSTSIMDANEQLAALVAAGGIASPRTIQVTAAAAANSTTAVRGAGAGCINNGGDGCSRNQEEDIDDEDAEMNISQSSETSSATRDCTPQSQLCSNDHCSGEKSSGNSVSETCWIQDVLSLIISPKDRTCSPSAAGAAAPSLSCCAAAGASLQQLSPTMAKCATSPCSAIANIPALHGSCASYGGQFSNRVASPEYYLYTLFDDYQHPLEGLASDGFTAISAAVTTRKRFDTETAGPSCDVDGTQLWSYVC